MSEKNLPNNVKFAWLKDSQGEWNYARITGTIMLLVFQPLLLVYMISKGIVMDVNNLFQWLILCSPSITSAILFLIEFFRDKSSMKIKFRDFHVEYDKDGKDNKDTEE